jgi:hypothetical protein
MRLVDRRHAAFAERTDDRVRAEVLSGEIIASPDCMSCQEDSLVAYLGKSLTTKELDRPQAIDTKPEQSSR